MLLKKAHRYYTAVSTVLQLITFWLRPVPSYAKAFNLTLSVEEGLPAGTIVGDLRAVLPEDTSGSGFFISESKESYVFKDLEIDGDTGIISTTTMLDRESRDKYEFVAATLSGEMIKVMIEVRDVNDHAPVFMTDTVCLNISEQSPNGSRFHLEGALDEDEGEFGTQGYRIIDSAIDKLFKVEYRGAGGNFINLDLILSERLDREMKDFYVFSIEAFDGGIPPKTCRLQVEIFVLDENDNTPVFNQTEYQAFIWENTPLLTPVCQVYAVDLDLGRNGQVSYQINRRQSDPNELFTINTVTGLIQVNKALDFETQPFHELIISAQDNGSQPEYSNVLVVVNVLNVNDNSPTIHIMFLSESGLGEVSERVTVGHYVARISVSDPDPGLVNRVRVSLEGGDERFVLKPSDDFLFSLCVNGKLDREEVDFYDLKIVASDFGAPSLLNERTFLIKVTDVNDCSPVFEKDTYTVNISEGAVAGSFLLHVRAQDLDEGVNSAVCYMIAEPDQGCPFNIDTESGLITTAAQLDCERESEFHFSVIAFDGGYPPLFSTASVTVYVEDINDNRPVFEKQLYNVFVPEHFPVGSCFLQVSAMDADGGEFGTVRYSFCDILDNYSDHPFFHVHPDSGAVCISSDIDRDAGMVEFDVMVKAEDRDGLSDEAFIHIVLEDINDNRPVFSPERYEASISADTQPGTEVLNVFAADRDSGSLGLIFYEILPGDLLSLFEVDLSSGAVHVIANLSHFSDRTVRLFVSARDGAGLGALQAANITIHILRGIPTPAVFQRSSYTFSVPEDVPVGTSVGTVRVTGPGSVDVLNPPSYSISSGDPQGLFSVCPQSGLISTHQVLDREAHSHFLLVLQSRSITSPVLSSVQVNITVTDINDNQPMFPRENDSISIIWDMPLGAVLFIARAHDEDAGPNRRILYSLPEDVDSGVFAINADLGTVFLNQTPALDGPSHYSLRIQAQDQGTPALSSTMTLSITVNDSVVAGTLAFDALVYQAEISESAWKNSRIIQVQAHERLHLNSPRLSYSLLRSTSTLTLPFRIHAQNGWMILTQGLDFESQAMYHFTVLATKPGTRGGETATATVIITVLDDNDNSPVFTQDTYFYTLQEASIPQGCIGTVRATDRDSGKNSQITYFLLSDGKHFRVNPSTGEVVNWMPVDREQSTHHTLQILAVDHGSPRLSSTARVHILVADANDTPPRFVHPPPGRDLAVQLWAGLPAGSLVTTVFAKDTDAGENGTVHYSLLSGDDLGHFQVDCSSGDIRTTDRFSEHHRNHYTLNVAASDSGPTPLQELAVIHLQVYPAETPSSSSRQASDFIQFSVREDTRPGTIIGSLKQPRGPLERVVYHISGSDGEGLRFGVDATSGDMYVTQQLDYESAPHHLLSVRVERDSPGPAFARTLSVSVCVQDVNDHVPWFPDDVLMIGLNEDLPPGTRVYVLNARDGDGSTANSALRYAVSSESDVPFTIDPLTGALTTTRAVDREVAESFAFMVTATDQADKPSERRQAALTIWAVLLDVNDNSPVFTSFGSVYVPEDATVGSLLHRLIAEDTDLGENGLITYSILSGDEEGHFALEERTGCLRLARCLDYELARFHVVVAVAVDKGQETRSSTHTLTVSVLDVNDHAPQFERSVYTATVSENMEPGELLIKVSAFDQDSERNAAVTYSLLPGPGFGFFTVNPHIGEVRTTAWLDRELNEIFLLRVVARDSAARPLSAMTTVLCSVLDDNDNSPRFLRPASQIIVPENTQPGVIYTALADDPDAGLNGTIRYSITGDFGHFVINDTTGTISTLQSLDREERSSYNIVIEAHDQGPIPRSCSANLLVLVLDRNDHSPVFSQESYHASVREDVPVGSEVIELTATDDDQGSSGTVTFSILDDTMGMFSINTYTGVVKTSQRLDRETRARYVFRAAATDDCSQGPRSAVAVVTVNIEDINDNAPVFPQSPVSALISADTTVSQTIVTMTAIDRDQEENGTVVFSLSQPDAVFSISRHTGKIQLETLVSFSTFDPKYLCVIASDTGSPAMSSSSLVLIHLQGEEPRLQFRESSYSAVVPENSQTGSWVVNVAVQDHGTSQGTVTYSIFSGNDDKAFAMDPRSGDISVKEQSCLDFEERKEIHLLVVTDDGQQTAHCSVLVSLLDINDNVPAFQQSSYKASVWEGQVHNTYVTQVFAADKDSGTNGQIDYSIHSGNHNNAFLMDTAQGILTTSAVLDREITSAYVLVIQATDRGSPRLTGTATIWIQVVDINDNGPVIPPMKPVVILENLMAGHVVTQVTANDKDLSSTMTYSFADQGSTFGHFAIDPFSGVITLTRSLDREEQSEHMLRVYVSDSAHHTEAQVNIQVLDVNDNPPVFTQEAYQAVLTEQTPAGTYVLTVSASDRDSGPNSKMTYRLLSSTSKGFTVSPENGSVYTNMPLQYIAGESTAHLLVEARDSGNPALAAVTSVDVQVQDHVLTFWQDIYRFSVAEDTAVGSKLLLLSPEGPDQSRGNTHLTYSITEGNEERRFCIDVSLVQAGSRWIPVAKLVLCHPLDREGTSSYTLTVIVFDEGTPSLTCSVLIVVTVLDVNDNAPVFDSTEHHVQISESDLPGTVLVQVSARDLDQGPNAHVRYDIISGNVNGCFRLDHLSGSLELHQKLDYEKDAKFTLTLQASDEDGSGQKNVAFAVVYITVLDENDNFPYFILPVINCIVMENQPAFSPVCSIQAVDHDAGPYGQMTYCILSPCFPDYRNESPKSKEAFTIDVITGDIHTKQVLDYERQKKHCLVVEARDKGDQATTVRVEIDVQGVDEFIPVFTQQQYQFQLPKDAQGGESVGEVKAVDHDGGLDGVVEYALISSSQLFSVNKTSGIVYLSDVAHKRKRGEHLIELLVKASSPKMDSKSASCLVTINVSTFGSTRPRADVNAQTISLSVSLVAFLLLFISSVGLILKYTGHSVLQKSSNRSQGTGTLDKANINRSDGIILHDLSGSLGMVMKGELSCPYRSSDSSGRGSAKGDIAEDDEIKMINIHSCCNSIYHVPDSGVLVNLHQLSYPSEDGETELETASSKCPHICKEESTMEGIFPQEVQVASILEDMQDHPSLSESRMLMRGSLASLACSEEEFKGSYSWDYLQNWEPWFQPLTSVFLDIGLLPDKAEQIRGFPEDSCNHLQTPPLITSVVQPGVKATSPRMPLGTHSQPATMYRRPSFHKYSYSTLARDSGLIPSAMTPNFSPAISLLTSQSPPTSPGLPTGLCASGRPGLHSSNTMQKGIQSYTSIDSERT